MKQLAVELACLVWARTSWTKLPPAVTMVGGRLAHGVPSTPPDNSEELLYLASISGAARGRDGLVSALHPTGRQHFRISGTKGADRGGCGGAFRWLDGEREPPAGRFLSGLGYSQLEERQSRLCLFLGATHRPIPWWLSRNSCGTFPAELCGEGRCRASKTRSQSARPKAATGCIRLGRPIKRGQRPSPSPWRPVEAIPLPKAGRGPRAWLRIAPSRDQARRG